MFKMQKQAYRHDAANGIWGDCHRTAIANLLGVDRDDVPHTHEDLPVDEWTALIDAYLETLGLREIRLHLSASKSEILAEHAKLNPAISYILSGLTRRGTPHSVLCFGGTVIFDSSLEDDSELVAPMNEQGFGVSYIVPRRRRLDEQSGWERLVREWHMEDVVKFEAT